MIQENELRTLGGDKGITVVVAQARNTIKKKMIHGTTPTHLYIVTSL